MSAPDIEAAAKAEYEFFFDELATPWDELSADVRSRLLRGMGLAFAAAFDAKEKT